MSAANKAKGTRFESEVADYLQGQGIMAKRLPRAGVKDIGDVAFPLRPVTVMGAQELVHRDVATVVLEAKNRQGMSLPEWIAESEVEAQHYQEKYPAEGETIPVVIHKRRGKGVHQSYVTMSLDTFVDLLRQVGAV